MTSQRGFTLIEILLVTILMAITLGVMTQVLRFGTTRSLQGLRRVEIVMEARRLLEHVKSDLRVACFPLDIHSRLTQDFSRLIFEQGSAPLFEYHFQSLPLRGEIPDVVPYRSFQGKPVPRLVSEITYRLLPNENPRLPLMTLVREERFHPGHPMTAHVPGGVLKHILSQNVSFFEIRPFEIGEANVRHGLFLITVQLGDTVQIDPKALRRGTVDQDIRSGMVLADFYDVVQPEIYNSFWNTIGHNRNYYTIFPDPPSP